ncbi:MAG: hypothetical protein ACLFQ8_00075 [Candidatus Aenigmatarchaeota archaeon]
MRIKIPNEELVERIIKQKLKEKGVVRSQEELGEIVEKELKEIDDSFQISPERTRRIALNVSGVDVTVETKRSGASKPEKCPVCNEELKGLYAKNLEGERTQVGFRCDNCGYHGDVEEFMPMRYEFKLIKD